MSKWGIIANHINKTKFRPLVENVFDSISDIDHNGIIWWHIHAKMDLRALARVELRVVSNRI